MHSTFDGAKRCREDIEMVENMSANFDTPAVRGLPWKGAVLMVAALVAFYLLREHWNHIAGSAAYLLLLACPLMHLFGHGHGHGGGHGHHRGGGNTRPESGRGKEGSL
jgi:hypothetical protein